MNIHQRIPVIRESITPILDPTPRK